MTESVTRPVGFGGMQMDELYITSTTYGLNGNGLKEHPLAGSLFKVKLDVCGQPTYAFKG
jgi:sugar lactone lactonase YvrE